MIFANFQSDRVHIWRDLNCSTQELPLFIFTLNLFNNRLLRSTENTSLKENFPEFLYPNNKISSFLSLIVGFVLVIIFMIYKYKLFGLIANIALIANLIMLIGVLTILEATLTLPGIAGIILTVGMAVDANVLIFERIKEELKDEKNNIVAFDSGYIKSRTAIIDANITTLLAAIILFFMGSGPIKGFSVTLGIGIFTTLFSVYFIARLFTSLYVAKNRNKEKLI